MTQSDDKKTERERGILTPNDEEWLNGNSENPTDQKRRLGQGLQLAMGDIKKLIETDPEDVSNFAGIGELFDGVEENTDLDRVDCAESLIALAFIITNDSIEYSELVERVNWHPRTSSGQPSSSERNQSTRPPSYDVSEMLGFRNALSSGVNRGKQYVHQSEEIDFEHPIIKSNTLLYKEPSAENVNPDDNRMDFEVVRDIYSGLLDSTPQWSMLTDDLQVEQGDEDHVSSVEEAEDMATLQRIVGNITTRDGPEDSLELVDRKAASEYIAKDIEMMVNREIVVRHELLGGDNDFGYKLPENIGGELPGRLVPSSLGRRSTENKQSSE
ncbi:hypothetical protein [Halorubrum ezzemoulense]|uniref:hypothetical protein n=1 Tax=Halorubrum ezzemoulense TaxID=337243 RepID=UPI00117B5886|nr:hypothetical protein [Halorubrum ezzemoulense]